MSTPLFGMGLPNDDGLIRRRLEIALRDRGTHTLEDLKPMLASGAAQWWCNGDGAAVTEILDFPQCKVLNYWLVAGELRACLRMQPQIDNWAIGLGCTAAHAAGRLQWAAVGKPYGWRAHSVQFVKPLIWGASA